MSNVQLNYELYTEKVKPAFDGLDEVIEGLKRLNEVQMDMAKESGAPIIIKTGETFGDAITSVMETMISVKEGTLADVDKSMNQFAAGMGL